MFLLYSQYIGNVKPFLPIYWEFEYFSQYYGNILDMKSAFADYIKEVSEGTYPAEEHTFKIDDDVLGKLY